MSPRLVQNRDVVRRLLALAIVVLGLAIGDPARSEPADGKPSDGKPADLKRSEPEKPKPDPRLEGYRAPAGFKVRVVAAEPAIVDPAAMAFDDRGNLFVAEWRPADRTFETRDTLTPAEGESTQVRRTRKSTLDVVKKLRDLDGDGVYESSEVVLEGCEMPTSILPYRDGLYLTCVGRLEKWVDEDGDGHFESRTVLLDGFAAMDRRGLVGVTLGLDGWLYLATGDNDNHVVAPDGSRGDLSRTGGIFRCRPDGSKLNLFAMGLRNPYRGMAFDARFDSFVIDGDDEDGSKLQGLRLISPVEEGDYGWRLRAGSLGGLADFDRASVSGEGPGKLPIVARMGRGSASGLVSYNGLAFPDVVRDMLIFPDPMRRIVRGLKFEAKGSSRAFKGEATLLTAEDDQFRPVQVVVGADGALYVLDQRGPSPVDRPPGGEGKAGRLYRITWEGDKTTPAPPVKPNNWDRVVKAPTDELVFKSLPSPDHAEADRAVLELIDRGPTSLVHFVGWAGNPKAPAYTRLIAIQGARRFWCEQVETTMLILLGDADPDVRRVAAQALAWEPKDPTPRLVPKLATHLDDPDGRVVREIALAIGRHAEPRPQQISAVLLRWLIAHPQADPSVKDGFVRALERLGEAGVEEVAQAIRTRRGVEREAAVAFFAAFRTAPAAERLEGLVKVPDLTTVERVALIRQFARFPSDVPAPTQGLVDWLLRHNDLEPSVKIAALDACRMAGNPASSLVVSLLDDEDDAVRQAASRIASRSRPPRALEILIERLKSKETPATERLALVRTLRAAGPKAFDALDAAYLASEDPEFRRVALRSLTDADRGRATPALESTLNGPDPALRAQAARILGESPRTAPLLAKAFTGRNLQREELPIVLEALRKFDTKENRKLLGSIEEEASSGSAALNPSEIRQRVSQGGDPWAGLGVFFRESSRCSTCHNVAGRGGSFGPPLTLSSTSPPVDKLIESILFPSKVVDPRYESSRVTLKDGRSVIGIVVSKDDNAWKVKEPGGREARVARDQVDYQANERYSAMPAHISLDLTPEELVDLVAFLRSKPAQESLKHGPKRLDRALAIGPFPLGADRLRVPLDRIESSRSYEGQDGARVGWTVLEATRNGVLNLRGEMGPKPGRAYLAVEIKSPVDQGVALRFAVEGASRVYLNGSRVADVPEHEANVLAPAFAKGSANTLPALPDLARLNLKSGANLLLIAIDRADDATGDVRALVEIASPEPVEVRTPRN
jgi:quinoprotein glucose dehydrogenase